MQQVPAEEPRQRCPVQRVRALHASAPPRLRLAPPRLRKRGPAPADMLCRSQRAFELAKRRVDANQAAAAGKCR